MNEKQLIEKGYIKINDNTYEKLDKETGMKARLIFNAMENNLNVEDRIIKVLAS